MLVQIILFGQQKSDCHRTTDNAIFSSISITIWLCSWRQ